MKGLKTMFERRHYEAIAKVIKEAKELKDADNHNSITYDDALEHGFIDLFKWDNPNFNAERFIKASTQD